MEPSNLNEDPNEEAALAAMIRTHTPVLPDDGFSQRVLAALPRPKPVLGSTQRRTSNWTWIAYFGGGAIGAAFAVSQVGSWPKLGADVARFTESLVPAERAPTEPWLTIAFALCVLSLVVAWPFYRMDSGR